MDLLEGRIELSLRARGRAGKSWTLLWEALAEAILRKSIILLCPAK